MVSCSSSSTEYFFFLPACLKKCWKANFLTTILFPWVVLFGGGLPSSPLQQASRARQTRPGVQSICLDKCGDLGPRQAMQWRVLIVCVPSNSPQSPGLSSHSIHPGLCLLSNLNLTHRTRESGIQVTPYTPTYPYPYPPSHLWLLSVFWGFSPVYRHKM